MNQNQKRILTIVMVAITAMFLFPPFQILYKNGLQFNMGYSWIFTPPKLRNFPATVNAQLLLLQCLGVLIVGGIALFLSKNVSSEKKPINADLIGTSEHCKPQRPYFKYSENKTTSNNARNSPSGVGGWLMLLVASLMVFGPLFGAGRISAAISLAEETYPSLSTLAAWNTYTSATWGTFLVVSALSFYGGWGLAAGKNRSVVNRAKTILWVTGPVAYIITEAVIPMTVFKDTHIMGDPTFIGSLIVSIFAAFIWTQYLSKSKRVHNTYSKGCNREINIKASEDENKKPISQINTESIFQENLHQHKEEKSEKNQVTVSTKPPGLSISVDGKHYNDTTPLKINRPKKNFTVDFIYNNSLIATRGYDPYEDGGVIHENFVELLLNDPDFEFGNRKCLKCLNEFSGLSDKCTKCGESDLIVPT